MWKKRSSQLFIPPLSHTSPLLSHYKGLIFKLQTAVNVEGEVPVFVSSDLNLSEIV